MILGKRITVTDEVQTLQNFGDPRRRYSILNWGLDDPVYLRYRNAHSDTFEGNTATLTGMASIVIPVAAWAIIEPPLVEIDVVCATGEESEIRILPGIYGYAMAGGGK